MIVKLLTEHHLEFLSLKGGCRGSSESTHVKMPHCWKSHALAHMFEYCFNFKVKIKYEIFGEKGKLHSCLLLFYQLTKIGKIVL